MRNGNGGDYCNQCDTGHISWTCRNHPHLRWSGKNIMGRSLFYFGPIGYSDFSLPADQRPQYEPECICPASDLILDCPHQH
jgi:hypothetical protein